MADIVVIGAGGHIGYELCLSLVEQGHQTIALDFAFPEGVSGDMPDKPDNFLIDRADFTDALAMQEWLDKAQIVFHIGSTHLQVYAEDLPQWDACADSVKLLVDFLIKAEMFM